MNEQFDISKLYLWLFGSILIIIGLAAISSWFNKKRRDALSQICQEIGFSFSPKSPSDFLSIFDGFRFFSKGRSRKPYNISEGYRNNLSWKLFDYRYTVGGGKNSRTYSQTVACVDVAASGLPKFMLGSEWRIFHLIGDVFGFRDIDFVDSPAFSRQYLLKGQDEDAIRRLFTAETRYFFEQKKNAITLNIESDSQRIIVFYSAKLIAPQDIKGFLDEVEEIIRVLIKV